MEIIPPLGNHNFTVRVRAKSDYGEVLSDQYEFEVRKICEYQNVMSAEVMHLVFYIDALHFGCFTVPVFAQGKSPRRGSTV